MLISHRAGEFFALSDGEYSDYAFRGLYRATQDFDLATLADEFLPHLKTQALLLNRSVPDWIDQEDPDEVIDYLGGHPQTDGFGAYLIRRGVAEPIDYDEIHVGYRLRLDTIREHAHNRAEQLAKKNQAKRDNLDFQTLG